MTVTGGPTVCYSCYNLSPWGSWLQGPCLSAIPPLLHPTALHLTLCPLLLLHSSILVVQWWQWCTSSSSVQMHQQQQQQTLGTRASKHPSLRPFQGGPPKAPRAPSLVRSSSWGGGRAPPGKARPSASDSDLGLGLILGPGEKGGTKPGGKPLRLIIPGGDKSPGPGGGPKKELIIADEGSSSGLGADLGGSGTGVFGVEGATNTPTTANRFRPPPGFMNEQQAEDGTAKMTPEAMLSRLSSGAGMWYEVARYFPALNARGYSSSDISEATGVAPVQQNSWLVGSTVYESLAQSK